MQKKKYYIAGRDLPPVKWNGSFEELKASSKDFKRRQRITYTCKRCGKEETMSLDRILMKDDLYCKNCSSELKFESKYGEGITNPSLVQELIEKRKETFANKTEAEKAESNKKRRETMNDRYGGWYTQTEEYKIKSEATSMKRYGTRIGSMSEEVKERTRQNNIAKYGVDNPAKDPDKKAKSKKYFQDTYGVDNPSQIKSSQKKDWNSKLTKTKERVLAICNQQNLSPLFNFEKDYTGNVSLYKFKCNTCNTEFESFIDNDYTFYCPNCKKDLPDSRADFINYIKSIYDGDLIENESNIISPLILDIYLPEKNLAFAFNKTFYSVDESVTNIKDFRVKDYNKLKSDECEKKGIKLIHIFEYEWNLPVKKQKIKNYVKYLVNGPDYRIFARKCVVKEISGTTAKTFLDRNHLQGSNTATVKLGLYYNNELVEVMTFGKPRFNKKYEYELSRLASKEGYEVVGGAGKLLNYFEKVYKPSSLISYCDVAKMRGNLYKQLGFTLRDTSKANYVWVSGLTVLTRYQCQKHQLAKEGYTQGTEDDIMRSRNFTKVFDAGNYIFIKEHNQERLYDR